MQNKLWTKNFLWLCIANFFLFAGFYSLIPTLPMYVAEVLNGSASQVGIIIGVLSITAVISRMLAGYTYDAVGRKKVIMISMVGLVLAMACYHFAFSVAALVLLRLLHGAVWGFPPTGTVTIAADLIPAARRGEGMGYFGLSNTLGMAIGPALGIYVMRQWGYGVMINGGVLITMLSYAFIAAISYAEQPVREGRQKPAIGDFFEERVFSSALITFFLTFVYTGATSFITLFCKEIGVEGTGSYFIVYSLSLIAVRPVAGKIFDKNGPNLLLPVGFLLLAISFVLLYLSQGLVVLLISAAFFGCGFGIIQPVTLAMAINRVEPERRGAANGTVYTSYDLGIAIGAAILGYLVGQVGLGAMFLVCAAIVLIPWIYFYIIDVPKYRRPSLDSE